MSSLAVCPPTNSVADQVFFLRILLYFYSTIIFLHVVKKVQLQFPAIDKPDLKVGLELFFVFDSQ